MVEEEASNPTKGTNVQVVIRIRPENEFERRNETSLNVVIPNGEKLLTFDPKENNPLDYFKNKPIKHRDLNKRVKKDKAFAFDRVFDEFSTNEQIYHETTKLTLDSLLEGYNCSIFAYGATGSGKTFSMLGNAETPGVIYLTMIDLYKRIEELQEEKIFEVKVAYMEVYNEQIRDLLPAKETGSNVILPIREDPRLGVVVKGLTLHNPATVDQLVDMLKYGNGNRTQHPTDANAESSRSHAVFQVFVQSKPRTVGVSTDVQMSKMCLIDLAGSERATATKNRGARFKEGANINQSLLALGNVINALADTKVKSKHVPYRNSKLTRLLKDSLGGNCRTVMIATVSPSSLTYDDTYNTLSYADRAKRIKIELQKNVVNVDVHISRYSQVIDELRKQVRELKMKLTDQELAKPIVLPPQLNLDKVFDLQQVLHRVFVSRIGIQREVLELEACEHDLLWKLSCKKVYLDRFAILHSVKEAETNNDVVKLHQSITSMESRLSGIAQRKAHVLERMADNNTWLNNVEADALSIKDDKVMPEILAENIRTHHLEVELKDSKRYINHLKKMLRSYERERQNEKNLTTTLLKTVKDQRAILLGHNWLTSNDNEQYTIIVNLALNEREVKWADQSEDEDVTLQYPNMSILQCVKTTPATPQPAKQQVHLKTPNDLQTPKLNKRKTPDSRPMTPTLKAPKFNESNSIDTKNNLSIQSCLANTPNRRLRFSETTQITTPPNDMDSNRESIEHAGHTPFAKRINATNKSPEPHPLLLSVESNVDNSAFESVKSEIGFHPNPELSQVVDNKPSSDPSFTHSTEIVSSKYIQQPDILDTVPRCSTTYGPTNIMPPTDKPIGIDGLDQSKPEEICITEGQNRLNVISLQTDENSSFLPVESVTAHDIELSNDVFVHDTDICSKNIAAHLPNSPLCQQRAKPKHRLTFVCSDRPLDSSVQTPIHNSADSSVVQSSPKTLLTKKPISCTDALNKGFENNISKKNYKSYDDTTLSKIQRKEVGNRTLGTGKHLHQGNSVTKLRKHKSLCALNSNNKSTGSMPLKINEHNDNIMGNLQTKINETNTATDTTAKPLNTAYTQSNMESRIAFDTKFTFTKIPSGVHGQPFQHQQNNQERATQQVARQQHDREFGGIEINETRTTSHEASKSLKTTYTKSDLQNSDDFCTAHMFSSVSSGLHDHGSQLHQNHEENRTQQVSVKPQLDCGGDKKSILRSLKFDEHSPTFADIVKSPGRSPLLPVCLNTIDNSGNIKPSPPIKQSTVSDKAAFKPPNNNYFRFPMSETKQFQRSSAQQSSKSSDKGGAEKPKYMDMTTSANRKKLTRSISSRDIPIHMPRRQFLINTQQHKTLKSSGKSSSHLVR